MPDTITNSDSVGWQIVNTYSQLPDVFFDAATPATFAAPQLVILNDRLAADLGLDFSGMPADSIARLFAGQQLPSDSRPIAQAYAGHQFGSFTMLGDGRAILVGEHRTPAGGLVDIQLKGAGRTRFSRGGDGRAALGPMLREYLISEAMASLGIPTTRSLAVVTTGEAVYRTSALRGAVLTRVATSHIRVGTFQYLAARQDISNLRALADYAIERHDPNLVDSPQKYLDFFRSVLERQASLIAQWQLVGFIHGVMNTDNMAVSGETIDYGPCAFMNRFHPETVFSSIDHAGRYAYVNQPRIAQWNLARLAESLLPLIDTDTDKAVAIATEALGGFPGRFEHYWLNGMRKKLGLQTAEDGDMELAQSLLDWMEENQRDFTNTFRDLSISIPSGEGYCGAEFAEWLARWQQRLEREKQSLVTAQTLMRSVNPSVIPRNHRVEEALQAAEQQDDLSPFRQLLDVLRDPYQDDAKIGEYRDPPPDETNYRTFCGT